MGTPDLREAVSLLEGTAPVPESHITPEAVEQTITYMLMPDSLEIVYSMLFAQFANAYNEVCAKYSRHIADQVSTVWDTGLGMHSHGFFVPIRKADSDRLMEAISLESTPYTMPEGTTETFLIVLKPTHEKHVRWARWDIVFRRQRKYDGSFPGYTTHVSSSKCRWIEGEELYKTMKLGSGPRFVLHWLTETHMSIQRHLEDRLKNILRVAAHMERWRETGRRIDHHR